MLIERVEIVQFRNLRDVEIEFPPEGSCLIGKNGQGKTNLIEAIYYLGTFRSFRTSREMELIRSGEEFFRLGGKFRSGERGGRIEAAYDGRKKYIKINGKKPDRIADAFGTLKAVVITPEDAEMIRSYPARRRKFMDIVISMTSKRYMVALTRYQAVLKQRNALLKERRREGITAWNAQLAVAASEVARMRYEFMRKYAGYYEEAQKMISGGSESSVSYVTNPREVGQEMEAGVRSASEIYEEYLERCKERDYETGTTTTGPHRDDIVIRLGRREMKGYGSQGQHRTSVFALRIAEARYIEDETGERPLMLLDDVLGQLDEERGKRLMDMVYERYQTIITSPREEDAKLAPEILSRIRVERGELIMEKQ